MPAIFSCKIKLLYLAVIAAYFELYNPIKTINAIQLDQDELQLEQMNMPNQADQVIASNHRYENETFRTNLDPLRKENLKSRSSVEDDSNNRSIYSSLVKILYLMKQQMDKSKANKRADDDNNKVEVSPTISKSPVSSSQADERETERVLKQINKNEKIKPGTGIKPSSQTTTEPMVILEVTSEPFTESSSNEIQKNQVVTERADNFPRAETNPSAKYSDSKSKRDEIGKTETNFGNQASSSADNQQYWTGFSSRLIDKEAQKSKRQPSTNERSKDDDLDIDRPLFTFSSSPFDEGAGTGNLKTFNSIYDNLADSNDETPGAHVDSYRNKPTYNNADDSYESRPASIQTKSYPKRKKSKFVSSPSLNNFSPLKKTGIRYLKPGERIRDRQPDQQYEENGTKGVRYSTQTSGYVDSQTIYPRQFRSNNNYNGIHLQQVYDSPTTTQQQLYQQPQQSQQTLYSLSSLRQPNEQSSTSYESSGATSNNHNQPQRDLLNQPQTIQITAVPNAGLPLINALRVNGFNGLNNGLVGNGLLGVNGLGNGFLDPLGRQVVMVNADRRQIDWQFWIWPLLIAIALPLVLGALFVPIFLKTIVILIQVLQSLGLLLPITNALNNQIAQASGVNTSMAQVEQIKT